MEGEIFETGMRVSLKSQAKVFQWRVGAWVRGRSVEPDGESCNGEIFQTRTGKDSISKDKLLSKKYVMGDWPRAGEAQMTLLLSWASQSNPVSYGVFWMSSVISLNVSWRSIRPKSVL